MRIHLVTVGKPKIPYARAGWEEYFRRLDRIHKVRVSHIGDKYADDAQHILGEVTGSSTVVLEISGVEYSSEQLAGFLRARELESREVSFIIGGPDGLPQKVRDAANFRWSLGRLTLPHDLAMIVTLEALYRASSINLGLPYHK